MPYLRMLCCLAMLLPLSCPLAAPIIFNLNDGSFVTLPAVQSQPAPYPGVYQSPTFNIQNVTINGGQSTTFDFIFQSGGNSQSIRLTDSNSTLPNEGVIFDVFGSGSSLVNPVANLTGATGSYRQDASTNIQVSNATVLSYAGASELFDDGIRIGEFSSLFPNDPARFLNVGLDVTQGSIMFTDLHLEIFNQGPDPITISALSFQAIANQVEIVPEPVTLVLTSLGILGIGWQKHRRKT